MVLGNSLIIWRLKKQTIIAQSTVDAEYRAMSISACEVYGCWLYCQTLEYNIRN